MLLFYSRGYKADLKVLWCQVSLGGLGFVGAEYRAQISWEHFASFGIR